MSQSPHRFLLVSDASAFSRSSPSVTARSFRFCKPRKKSRSDCEANGDWMQTTEGFTSWNDNTLSSTLQHVTFCSHIHALQTSPGVFFFLFYPFLLFLVIPCHNSQLITVLLLPPFSFLLLFLSFSSPPSFNVEAMAMVTSPPSSAYILQLMNGKSHTNHALGHFASPECQCSLWPRVADLVQIRFAWQGWGFVQAKLWKKHTILAHLHLISVLAEALLWHVHNHNLKDPVIGTSNSLTLQSWTAARGLILLAPVSSRLMQLSWDLGLPNHQHSNPWQCSWVMKSNTDLYMAVVRVQLLFQANTAAVHNAPKSLPKRATYFLPLVEAKPSTFVMVSAWIPVTLPPKNQTMVGWMDSHDMAHGYLSPPSSQPVRLAPCPLSGALVVHETILAVKLSGRAAACHPEHTKWGQSEDYTAADFGGIPTFLYRMRMLCVSISGGVQELSINAEHECRKTFAMQLSGVGSLKLQVMNFHRGSVSTKAVSKDLAEKEAYSLSSKSNICSWCHWPLKLP